MKAIEVFDPEKPEGKSGFRVEDHIADAIITLLMSGFTDRSKQE